MSGGDSGRGGQSEGGGDGDGGQDGGRQSEQQGASTAEKAVMVVSAAFTVVLFAYVGWQIAVPPQADSPQVSIVGTDSLTNDSVGVTVRLSNPTDVGYVSVTVESDCTSPPSQVQFSYVPASTARTGTIVCPAGTSNLSASIASWSSR